MRKLIALLFACVAFTTPPAFACDLEKGFDAYVKGDYETALYEWQDLAERGHAVAQHNIGLLYADGEGVSQDYVRAYMWISLAVLNGDRGAEGAKNLLVDAELITAPQIEEAQELAQECVAKNYKGC